MSFSNLIVHTVITYQTQKQKTTKVIFTPNHLIADKQISNDVELSFRDPVDFEVGEEYMLKLEKVNQ